MKSIEYYCSTYFDPRDAQELSAPQYFIRKISAAEQTVKDLLEVELEARDGHYSRYCYICGIYEHGYRSFRKGC